MIFPSAGKQFRQRHSFGIKRSVTTAFLGIRFIAVLVKRSSSGALWISRFLMMNCSTGYYVAGQGYYNV